MGEIFHLRKSQWTFVQQIQVFKYRLKGVFVALPK